MGVRAFQTSLAGGELSPFLFARSDFDKYRNGAETLLNCVVKVTGGAARRAGSQYIAEAKAFYSVFQYNAFQVDAFQVNPSALATRLIPFVFNVDQAYVLEFGHEYIRFYRNRAPLYGDGLGAELLTNGDFALGLGGWTSASSGSGSVTSVGYAALGVGVGLGDATLYQSLTGLTVGSRYVFEFRVENAIGSVKVGTTAGGEDLVATTAVEPGTYRIVFIPTATTATILFYNNQSSTELRLDDVSASLSQVIELATPYSNEDVRQLRYTQSADTLYLAHPDHEPRKLTRISDTLWTLQIIAFQPEPSQETPLTPLASLTLGATSGSGVTFTTDAVSFLLGDVNKLIRSRGGLAVITAVIVGGVQVTVDILQQFVDVGPIGSGLWELVGSPSSNITMGGTSPPDALVLITAAIGSFRETDVGSFIKVNGGLLEIISWTSATLVVARVLTILSSVNGVAGAWTLESASWSTEQGFPGVVVFFEQRLWFASSLGRPQTIWGSAVADFENFAVGPNDDDSVEFTIASNTVDLIRWMKSIRNFLIGTIGSEFKMAGGNDAAISASNVLVSSEAAYGSDFNVDAIRSGNAVIFLQRSSRQIRELSFAYETDSYNAPDLTILAEHRFRQGIVDLAKASSPDSFLFAVTTDGFLNVCSYERPENVVAWSRWTTDGLYKAVCVIPGKCQDADEVWTIVEREVNGFTRRFVEVFDGQLNTDCALNYEVTEGSQAIEALAGLSHLEGEEVDVKWAPAACFQEDAFQRGVFQGSRPEQYFTTTVESGFVTLPGSAERVEVGLHYDTEIKTLRAELPNQQGTAMFRRKRSNVVYVRFYCSHGPGMFVEDEEVPIDYVSRTRDFRKVNLGWDREGQVTIRQTQPYGMVVLGVGYAYVLDDGEAP